MPDAVVPRPVTRADPACFDCGDLASPDYGSLFLQPAALGAVALWFDRAQRRFAMTRPCGRPPRIGDAAELHGRGFRIADCTDPAKADPAALAAWRRRIVDLHSYTERPSLTPCARPSPASPSPPSPSPPAPTPGTPAP